MPFSSGGFRLLYDGVTPELLSRGPSSWTKELIDGFEREYREWENPASPVRPYLKRLEEKTAGRKWLLLIGHAYLHISYDLPRVIAEVLRQHPDLNLMEARTAYEELRDTFRASWQRVAGDPRIVGGPPALFARRTSRDYLQVMV